MSLKPFLAVAYVLTCFLVLPCAKPVLNGKLTTDENMPLPNTYIYVDGGAGDKTDGKGKFHIELSGDYAVGHPIKIGVTKPGWVVFEPTGGKWVLVLEALQGKDLNVKMVPSDSRKFWTHTQLEKFMDDFSRDWIFNRVRDKDFSPTQKDITAFFNRLAKEYQLTPDQVRSKFDQWSDSAKKLNDDRKLGLLAFYERNFKVASHHLTQAGESAEAAIREAGEFSRKKSIEAFEIWARKGDAKVFEYQMDSALVAYLRARSLVEKDSLQPYMAQSDLFLAEAKYLMRYEVSVERSNQLSHEALQHAEGAMKHFNRKSYPAEWSRAQDIKGNLLTSLAHQSVDGKRRNFQEAAMASYDSVLLVLTMRENPKEWAATQNNRAILLLILSEDFGAEQALKYLAEAKKACDNALLVFTKREYSQEWSAVYNNLGNRSHSLSKLARNREQQKAALLDALASYDSVMVVRSRAEMPREWASTLYNKGNILRELGSLFGGKHGLGYFQSAENAYDSALMVQSLKGTPEVWSNTQDSKGALLAELGRHCEGECRQQFLQKAVAAFDSALIVRTKEEMPSVWVATQINQGHALMLWGLVSEGEERKARLGKSKEAFEKARSRAASNREMYFMLLNRISIIDAMLSEVKSDPN